MKKSEPILDMEKALHEKETMQKNFIRNHGCESYVLGLIIEYFKEQLEKIGRREEEWKSK